MAFLSWYLVITIAGWLVFPLAYRFLPALSDRGYAVSRALGLLLWGYIYWLLASLGILRNTQASLLLTLMLVGIAGFLAACAGSFQQLKSWIFSRRRYIWVTEAVFLTAFTAMAIIRSANPEAVGTEKPMELAFINAILHSPTFPPHDPWLSGFAISYYYFGYVLVAMLAMFTHTSTGVAFNLGTALVFGLSAAGAYGLVYNLIQATNRSEKTAGKHQRIRAKWNALLGPLFLLVISNLEGFLHAIHSRGWFWTRSSAGGWSSGFWTWLDINDLKLPPSEPLSFLPTKFWWWWRASRVIQDYDLSGAPREIINEFPFFSFLLADLHPHVLALPFAILALTLSLNLFLGGAEGKLNGFRLKASLSTLNWFSLLAIPAGLILLVYGLLELSLALIFLGALLFLSSGFYQIYRRHNFGFDGGDDHGIHRPTSLQIGSEIHVNSVSFILLALVLGGIAFLNTWDLPIHLALATAAYALPRNINEHKKTTNLFRDMAWFGGVLAASIVGLYFLFFISFASQAGGILPNLIYPTRGAQLWVMFGPFLVPLGLYMLYGVLKAHQPGLLARGLKWSSALFLALWLFSLIFGYLITLIPQVSAIYLGSLAAQDSLSVFQASVIRRLTSPGGWMTLGLMLALNLGLLSQQVRTKMQAPETSHPGTRSGDPQKLIPIFIMLLISSGLLLVTGPEFGFLRDQFGWRMNTIFKFYFQAWLFWSIAGAFGTAFLAARLKGRMGIIFQAGMGLLVLMSLVYPLLSLWNKTNAFRPAQWTLDGTAYLRVQSPDEMAVIDWLASAPAGVVAEAVPPTGGSYTQYGRVSMLSGKPAVLGWMGHESQWRGGGEAMGSRQSDLELLYCSRSWEDTRAILDQYQIRYIFLSNLERATYQPGSGNCAAGIIEEKFTENLVLGFNSGQVSVYEYSGTSAVP